MQRAAIMNSRRIDPVILVTVQKCLGFEYAAKWLKNGEAGDQFSLMRRNILGNDRGHRIVGGWAEYDTFIADDVSVDELRRIVFNLAIKLH